MSQGQYAGGGLHDPVAVARELRLSFPERASGDVRYLAAGEYTANYRVVLDGRDAVFRIVTGSQMGLDPARQVEYEAHALDLLRTTGRVPRLHAVEPRPRTLPYPYLLIEYLPGTSLDYRTDLVEAARCVAAIHRPGAPRWSRLQNHRDPVEPSLREVELLLQDLPRGEGHYGAVFSFRDRVLTSLNTSAGLLAHDPVIVNTDLNSHNFIVNGGRARLVDWEKARIGPSSLDLAHFLLPTTTLWRDESATRLSREAEAAFVDAYLTERPNLDPASYRRSLQHMKWLAALRAVAWCAWALDASAQGTRPIEHAETLAKCRLYTSHAFLDELTADLWD